MRFIYNQTPSTRILQAKSSIPAALHYTPLEKMDLPRLEYVPITCQCEALFSHYSHINYNQKTVTCCFCRATTSLPANYAQKIHPNQLPYEFMEGNTTLEFKSGGKVSNYRSSYILVVDTNL